MFEVKSYKKWIKPLLALGVRLTIVPTFVGVTGVYAGLDMSDNLKVASKINRQDTDSYRIPACLSVEELSLNFDISKAISSPRLVLVA